MPPGVDRPDATISYNGLANGGSGRARMILFDPEGRDPVYTLNQGVGGFGQVDVHQPESGTWTALIWMIDVTPLAYVGPVHFTMTAQHFESGGSVVPAMTMLQPGETRMFQVTVYTPAVPGDDGASLVFGSDHNALSKSVPVIKRSLIPLSEQGGHFTVFSVVATGACPSGPRCSEIGRSAQRVSRGDRLVRSHRPHRRLRPGGDVVDR